MRTKAKEAATEVKLPSGAAYKIKVDGYSAYLKELDKATLEISIGLLRKDTPEYIRAGEVILGRCWISGDEELRSGKTRIVVGAAMQAYELIDIAEGEVEKL